MKEHLILVVCTSPVTQDEYSIYFLTIFIYFVKAL